MKRILFFLIHIILTAALSAQTIYTVCDPMPKREVRGVWLTTLSGLDWPKEKATSESGRAKQKAELCKILDQLQQCGMNTVFLQTRVRGSVIYPSKIEPWDVALTGQYDKDPGYDPLAFAIEETHKRGMELHAWIVTIPSFKIAQAQKMGKRSLLHTHPTLLRKHQDTYYLDPGLPGVSDYLTSICQEIVEKYDVDGIHLDYIRYPENAGAFPDGQTYKKYGPQGQARQNDKDKKTGKQNDKDKKTAKQTGKAAAKSTVPVSPEAKNDWRRNNITAIVRQMNKAIKSRKPWVRFSCSPVGKFDDVTRFSAKGWAAYSTVFQDAQGWLCEGIMDMLCPMMYFEGDHFYPFAADWQENAHGRIIAPGLGIYFLHPKERDWSLGIVQRELNYIRQQGLQGQAYFRSRFLTDNTKGIYDYLEQTYYPYRALTPALTWQNSTAPETPKFDKRERKDGIMERITWKPVEKDGQPCRYVIYASKETQLDISRPENIVCIVREPEYTYNLLSATLYDLHLAITALDRFGNESAPLEIED